METKKVEDKPDRELILHYLDQVLDAYKEGSKTQNRLWLLINIFSFIVIALSNGFVSVNQNISVLGVLISIPTWLILLSSAYIIGILFVYFVSIYGSQYEVEIHIYKLYKSIGYKEEDLLWNTNKRFTFHTNYLNSFTKLAGDIGNKHSKLFILLIPVIFIYTFILFILPVLAQAFAIYKLFILFRWAWWLIPAIIVLISIDITSILGMLNEAQRNV